MKNGKTTSPKTEKKNRIEYLREQYCQFKEELVKNKLLPKGEESKKVTEEEFNAIVNSDPSPNKQYVQWILNMVTKERMLIEDLYKATQYLEMLYLHKGKINEEKRDITKYRTLPDLFEAVEELLYKSEEELLSKSQKNKIIKEEGIIKYFENDRWVVLTPLTLEAAIFYGAGTQWCTAAKNNSMFKHYTKNGEETHRLYIIIDKSKTNREKDSKFQFHFPTKQFMDAQDRSIDWKKLLKDNVELLEAFANVDTQHGLKIRFMFGLPIEKRNLIIKGDFDMTDIESDSLPEGMIIHGTLNLEKSKIKFLKDIIVHGDMILKESEIERIEGKCFVGGYLKAKDAKKLKSLPENLVVGTSCEVTFTALESLPKGLKVKNMLYASETKITEVGEGIEVGGNLYMHYVPMSKEHIEAKIKDGSLKVGGKIIA